MNKTMKIAIPAAAAVVAIGTGFGLAAAKGENGAPAAAYAPVRYDAVSNTPTATPAPGGTTVEPYWCGGPNGIMSQVAQTTGQRVANLLGMTTTDLQAQLQSGKTLADIAAANGVSQDTLAQTIIGPMDDQMDLMVKYGYLTQEQANGMLQRMQAGVQNMMTGNLAGPNGLTSAGGYGWMAGMMGGWGASGTGVSPSPSGGFGGGMMGGIAGGRGGMMGGW